MSGVDPGASRSVVDLWRQCFGKLVMLVPTGPCESDPLERSDPWLTALDHCKAKYLRGVLGHGAETTEE
jgi:hypothetical protein